ncbi:MAG: hypothetical protein KBT20_04270 [Bacteroidales bacterium]|nr:hypothetical protein [Candidatus Liminaster caballi]
MTHDELQKLRDLDCFGVAERLGLTLSRGRFLCPAHEDHKPSASISRARNVWRCWACGAGGNTIDLTMMVLNKSFREACEWLADTGNVIIEDDRRQPRLPMEDRKGTFDPTRYARFFEHPWLSESARRFLFDRRRLKPSVVNWCRVTSWTDREGVAWLQIPYYDVDGRLIGVQNRNLGCASQPGVKDGEGNGQPRFRFPSGSRTSIYNLPIVRHLKTGDECWIAEGCSDAWSHMSDGHKVLAIGSATLLQAKDKDLLRELTARLQIRWRMSPDNDEPGRMLYEQLKRILPMLEYVALPEGCKDYSDAYVMRVGQERDLSATDGRLYNHQTPNQI